MAGKGFSKGHKKVGGRVKGQPNRTTPDVRIFAREYTVTALEVLVAIMNDKDAQKAVRVSAATALLDRAWGKPGQSVEVTGQDGSPLIWVDRYQRRCIIAGHLHRHVWLAPCPV